MTKSRERATSRTAPFTALQGQYLAFMHTYEGIHGCAPAEADLQRHFGVTPPSVHQMVVTLERKGLITRVVGAGRSIKLQVAPATLPPLERRHASGPDHQKSQLVAVRSRKAAEQTKRKASSSKNPRISKQDSAAEYVNSPMMTKRLRFGRNLSAETAGRYGDYRTRVELTRKRNGDCTCPSDEWPCKHVRALRATWELNPQSFLDVEAFLRELDTRGKTELIETIGKIVIAFPQTLGLFGVAGFEETDDDDDVELED
ncbi:MAG: SWIM zinc finger family protein [Gemmatimonadaceae bacterium]